MTIFSHSSAIDRFCSKSSLRHRHEVASNPLAAFGTMCRGWRAEGTVIGHALLKPISTRVF